MSSASTITRFLVFLTVLGVFCSIGAVGTTAAPVRYTLFQDDTVTGSGSAGLGSLAVASFYSSSASTGAGGFSGTIGGVQASGLFSLTVNNPANAPTLPCLSGQVSLGGTVTSGSFVGNKVTVASCIGSGVPGYFDMFNPKEYSIQATGTGTAGLTTRPIKGGIVTAGATSGLGSAGPGTLYMAEADVATPDGNILGGGAFTGTISDINNGAVWSMDRASIQPGCVLTSSGTTASFGAFPNQHLSSTYTPEICPPPTGATFRAHFGMLLGVDSSPIFKSTGVTDSSIMELIGA